MPSILLVEDSEDILLLVQAFLEPYDIKLDFAQDGELALEMMLAHDYELVLMDLNIPKLSGKDCVEKALQSKGSLKVVAFSAAIGRDDRDSEFNGFVGRLRKPFSESDLVQTINRHIDYPIEIKFSKSDEEFSELSEDSEIYEIFLKNLKEQLLQMEVFFGSQNWEGLRKTTHRLKGSSYCFDEIWIANVCEEIEQALNYFDPDRGQVIFTKIQHLKKKLVTQGYFLDSDFA